MLGISAFGSLRVLASCETHTSNTLPKSHAHEHKQPAGLPSGLCIRSGAATPRTTKSSFCRDMNSLVHYHADTICVCLLDSPSRCRNALAWPLPQSVLMRGGVSVSPSPSASVHTCWRFRGGCAHHFASCVNALRGRLPSLVSPC